MGADGVNNTYNTGSFSLCVAVRGWWIRLFKRRVIIGHHLQQRTVRCQNFHSQIPLNPTPSAFRSHTCWNSPLRLCASWPAPLLQASVVSWQEELHWRSPPGRWAPPWGCWRRWASRPRSALRWWSRWIQTRRNKISLSTDISRLG